MRILHVNKFLYRRGGAEGYMEDLAALQEGAGHQVAFFAMRHPLNRPSRYEAHFPPYLELAPPPASLAAKVRATGRILYSKSARQGIEAVIEDFEPDLVHLHNIYEHLSPSILRPLVRRRIPAVMTLHDYKLACPTYQFLDNGKICEACLGGKFHNAVLRRCKNESLAASAVCATELFTHTLTRAYSPVARFVCPSRFMASKMEAAGVFPDRLRWVNHFVDTTGIEDKQVPGGGVVYAGRLSPEKGVDVLVEAVSRMGPGATLAVAGDGPDMPALQALATRVAPGQVTFHGRLPKAELHALVRASSVLAMPSRWYENQPMIVLEAFACGVPVVGTDLGGTPELIAPGRDGALVPINDPDALADSLRPFLDDPREAMEMGRAGRARVERDFSPTRHLQRLAEIYAQASASSGSPPGPDGSGQDQEDRDAEEDGQEDQEAALRGEDLRGDP